MLRLAPFLSLLFLPLLAQEKPELVPDATPPPETPAVETDPTRVSILGYHDFSEDLPETEMRMKTSKFRKQMEAIRQLGLPVITLQDFMDWKQNGKEIPESSLLITLDDGWKSVYTDAFPILREFGYPFTLYLYKNYVDGGGKALTTPMIREMIAAGASIGSHSVSHPYPATVKREQAKGPQKYDAYLRKEIGASKVFLESRFKTPILTYAYPGGFLTGEMHPLLEEFGYSHAFTVQPAKVTRDMPNDQLPRYMILGTRDLVFELATTFRDPSAPTAASAPSGTITGMIQSTPHPVQPEPGAIVNSRTPEITVDLTNVSDIDPASLIMRVSGFGDVPATFNPETKLLTWTSNRKLRHPTCQVTVTWKDTAGKPADPTLRWSFQLDHNAAYFPE
jgi:peptidoglycan/xylan/chitin deacetylase (PgdA/CDA1 family)